MQYPNYLFGVVRTRILNRKLAYSFFFLLGAISQYLLALYAPEIWGVLYGLVVDSVTSLWA